MDFVFLKPWSQLLGKLLLLKQSESVEYASCNLFCILTVLEAEVSTLLELSYIVVGGLSLFFFFKFHSYKKCYYNSVKAVQLL